MKSPQEIVEHAIRHNRLKLGFGHILEFYSLALVFLTFALIPLVMSALYNDTDFIHNTSILCFPIFLSVLALVAFLIQRNALKFKIINTILPPDKIRESINKLAGYYDWDIRVSEKNIIVADVYKYVDRDFDPPIIHYVIGERITVVLDRDKVYINSICNIDRAFRIGGAYKENRINIEIITDEIRYEEEKVTE